MAAPAIIASYSELDTYRQCPLKWQLSYRDRYVDPNRGLDRRDLGTIWHQVMEAHYRRLQEAQLAAPKGWEKADIDWVAEKVREDLAELLLGPDGAPRSEFHELALWMYQGHLERWGFDPSWEILGVEEKGEIPLLNAAGRRSPFRLKTKIDAVVRDWEYGGRIWVVDHKSGKDLPRGKTLDLDDQFGLYTLAKRRQGMQVFGQIYSAARTQRNKTGVQTPESRFERYRLYRDDRELLVLEADVLKNLTEAYRKRPPGYGDLPSSIDPDKCTWRCDFLEVHLQARKQARPVSEVAEQFGFEQNFERH